MAIQWLVQHRMHDGNDKETDFDKLGFPGFEDSLERVFAFEEGRWILKDIRVPKEMKP